MIISDINNNNEILSVPSRKRSRVDAEVDVSDDNSDLGDAPPSTNTVMNLFNLGSLKDLWSNGDYFEIGRQEIALLAAYKCRDNSSTNAEINNCGGETYSIADFDEIDGTKKTVLVRKIKNFDTLKVWINENRT